MNINDYDEFDQITLRLTGKPIHTVLYFIWAVSFMGGQILIDKISGPESSLRTTFLALLVSSVSLSIIICGTALLLLKKENREWLFTRHPMFGHIPISKTSLWFVRLFPLIGLIILLLTSVLQK